MAKRSKGKKDGKDFVYTDTAKSSKLLIAVTAKNPGQKKALKAISENQVTFVYGAPGSGKAQPLDSIVYCPDGPVKMGEIKVGDRVCTPDGKSAKVLAVYPQGEKDIYRINFADGASIECCKEHLWRISERSSKDRLSKKIVDTQYIIDNLKTKYDERNIYIELSNVVGFAQKELLIDPYVLGVLIGDGSICNANVCVSSFDEEILNAVSVDLTEGYSLKKSHRDCDYRIVKTTLHKLNGSQSNTYKDSLRLYDLWGKKSHEKFIPEDYLYSSEDQRWSILQGLMDTDGYVSKTSGQANFCTSSEMLAKDVKTLVDSLGGLCTISEKHPTYTYLGEKKNGRKAYICCLNLPDCSKAFRLNHKKNISIPKTRYSPKKRIVVSVECVGRKEAQCILIDSKDHLYLTDGFVVTHNTHCAVGWGVQELLKGNFERLVFTRPYVEAGEKLGYLPGNFDHKFAPFVMPLYEVVSEYLGQDDLKNLIEEKKIIVYPLAYMRGITFKRSYVVADEVQNSTIQQMRMMLTRVGEGTKIVCTGDVEQSDLGAKLNGLADAITRLQNIKGLEFVELGYESCVREKIVTDIDQRYKDFNATNLIKMRESVAAAKNTANGGSASNGKHSIESEKYD